MEEMGITRAWHFVSGTAYGLPKNTPKDVVGKLNDAVVKSAGRSRRCRSGSPRFGHDH